MSKKSELINIFGEYRKKYDTIQTKVNAVRKNQEFTDLGKNEEIKRILEGFTAVAQDYHKSAVEIISSALDDLVARWKNANSERLLNGNYQSGLSNVIKMLEIGSIVEKDDIISIIETYLGDYNALALISKLLKNSDNEQISECALMIPEDTRQRNKRLLEQLKLNVDTYIDASNINATTKSWNSFNQVRSGVSESMSSMSEFVNTKLNDDLSLI